jgi:Nucleotidyl transferase AbiEii toxin, Type IV TA system
VTASERRPHSASQLQRVVRAYAREYGLAEKRVRDWISYMAICGALERAGATGQSPPHYVKGGIALELRLPGKARATKDLDVGFRAEPQADLVSLLDDAIAAEYEGFSFRRARTPHRMPAGAIRVEVGVQYAGGAWGRVVVDVTRHEGHEEIELVDALDLGALFGVTGPDTIPALSLPWHVAHKIHAVSRPTTPQHPNERVQDAADLLLLQPLITDLAAVRRACQRVFRDRGTHPWPPAIAFPPTWTEPYGRLADELELTAPTLHAAANAITAWVNAIVSSQTGF